MLSGKSQVKQKEKSIIFNSSFKKHKKETFSL